MKFEHFTRKNNKNMRTKTAHQASKLSKIMSYETYTEIAAMLKSWYPTNPYPPTPENYFYKNTAHRNYLSKFMEQLIVKIASRHGYDARVVETTGKRIDNRQIVTNSIGQAKMIGSVQYIKDQTKKVGEPDTRVLMHGVTVYFEVKVGKDRLSDDQKTFIEAGKQSGYIVKVTKTADDFLKEYYPLKEALKQREEKIKQLGLEL